MKDFICKKCSRVHPLFYIQFSNGTEHLCYECTETKQRFFIHYVAGLKIERRVPRRVEKAKAQPDLFKEMPWQKAD